jgi:hypothetical protein
MLHKAILPAETSPERPTRAGLAWRRWFVPLALLLSIAPLLWPTVPPLIDLMNSMSRYRIALDYDTSPFFHRWFDFHWMLVGNLGVDLIVAVLAPFTGLEPATKLAVITIPLLTVGGLALIAREIHGRVPLTAALAFAFTYNFPFNFGFVNFCLSVGLALLVFGGWLRLGRLGRPGLRMALLVPAGFVVWISHAVGWGMLGVMIFAAELAGRREAGSSWRFAMGNAIVAGLPLLVALVPMAAWATGIGAGAAFEFNFYVFRKYAMLMVALKNDVDWVDVGSVLLVFAITTHVIVRKEMVFDARLASVGLAMLATFLVMPDKLMGSGYADLRIAPYALALLALAFRPTANTRYTRTICAIALCFFVTRTAYVTASYARIAGVQEQQLRALDHIPVGSRVFALANMDCIGDWRSDRMDHVNRMAIVRRQAFTNDTWPPTTASGLVVHPDMIAGYHDLDSQKLLPIECRYGKDHDLRGALAALPRDRFDYLWLIDLPAKQQPHADWLVPAWRGHNAILYRIRRERPVPPALARPA